MKKLIRILICIVKSKFVLMRNDVATMSLEFRKSAQKWVLWVMKGKRPKIQPYVESKDVMQGLSDPCVKIGFHRTKIYPFVIQYL